MVNWYQLINSDTSGKFIIHIVRNGKIDERIRYVSVRAGVSFPSSEAPGAFVVVGQHRDDKFDAGPSLLELLDEWTFEGLSIDAFWDKVTDALVLHAVAPLYFDDREEVNLSAFQDYCHRRGVNVDYAPAPFADNFYTGISTANDWLREGRLEIHKTSKTRSELKGITRDDLRENPELKYPLVNALRHVLCGFRKYPPTTPIVLNLPIYHDPQSWMA